MRLFDKESSGEQTEFADAANDVKNLPDVVGMIHNNITT